MSDAAKALDRLHISVSPAIKQVMPEFKISRAVRAGPWLFTNGQMDMGAGGKVLNPGDLMAQTFACLRSVYEVFAKADCRLAELAQLQIFYLATSVDDEAAYRAEILAEFPECADVLIVMTPVPSFATIGSEVEIDAIAVKGRRAAATDADGAVQAVRRGDWLFASSRAAPGTLIWDGLRAALARLDGALGDICRLYAYYPADLPAADRAAIERDLAAVFGRSPPAYHAALLPAKKDRAFAVELEAIAHDGSDADKVRQGRAPAPSATFDWPFVETLRCADVVFASGQSPTDDSGAIVHCGNIADQARLVMRKLEQALHRVGADMADLVKIKTYYEGEWDKENWFDNLRARMELLSDPGPASSGIEGLLPVMADTLLSVDGIAVVDGVPLA
ncbi:Rid family hydrolase [Sphingopyxis witflariensis]|uniref:Rid family hydrolase n=1 Tax=Sphingopyxis witflariensis TaxID=173675 RepID=UPI001181A96B|nr:Rid family hydrolase [Sphingopyxis witflariensis]